MKVAITKTLCLPILLSGLCAAAPEPEALLRQALGPVSVDYVGRLSVTQWFANRSSSEDVKVIVSKAGQYRREFLRPDGSMDRILASDGKIERLYLPKQHLVLTGYPLDKKDKLISPEAEMALLLANYRPELKGEETIAGRPTWRLELNAVVPGKPKQKFWVDQETGVVLQSMRVQTQGQIVTRTRYVRFEPQESLEPRAFDLVLGSGTKVEEHGLDPDYLTAAELRDAAKNKIAIPDQLPGNFVFESGDSFDLNRQPVMYLRYTDGLTIVSIFRTLRPVSAPPRSALLSHGPSELKSLLGTSGAGHIVQWKQGRFHFTLIGDLSYELLRQIQAALKPAS